MIRSWIILEKDKVLLHHHNLRGNINGPPLCVCVRVSGIVYLHIYIQTLNTHIIYIYIYLCVCVCVNVYTMMRTPARCPGHIYKI